MMPDRDSHFLQQVWTYYDQHARQLPWREVGPDGLIDPYYVLVSEIMLQQTQVPRVVPKYQLLLHSYPTLPALAQAPFSDVLTLWSGLGYNRRAKYLHDAAKRLQHSSQAWTLDLLMSCKGIGRNTAAAICVYSYNRPHLFVETNIRTVYLHHYFHGASDISDAMIIDKLASTMDHVRPREFYWALMDYGTFLKRRHGAQLDRSSAYRKQSAFSGSRRQLRGQAIRRLTQVGAVQINQLVELLADDRAGDVIDGLIKDGLVSLTDGYVTIAGVPKSS
jgi:A/G-specific adenine glycosylase